MTFDVLRPRGRSCQSCKHLSEDEASGDVLADFGYKGQYWTCEFRSHLDNNEVFPKRVIVYTDGSSVCSAWESRVKVRANKK